ncbi:MAG: nuclear transport factor 2 family protein [Gemmatimonadaceae bacterium]
MRTTRTAIAMVFSLVFAFPLGAQSVEKSLYKLEDDFAAAVVKRDVKTIQRLTAPKWVYSDESGVMERDAAIKTFTSGPDSVTAASNEKMRAIVYGNTAVVVGILHLKGRGPKGAFDNRYRFTDTWMEHDGHWQIIAAQDYLLPAAKH